MTDIVERLRALAQAKHDDLSVGDEAADEIEGLRREVLEQARLLGMSGEREADLRGEIERFEKELAVEEKRFSAQWEILAECQAREAKLRDFIVDYVDIEPNNERMIARYDTCVKPTDDTALREFKRKVLLDAADQLHEADPHHIGNTLLRKMAEEV